MRIKNEVRFNENEPIDYKFIRKMILISGTLKKIY